MGIRIRRLPIWMPRTALFLVQAPFTTGMTWKRCGFTADRPDQRSRYVAHGPDAAAVKKGSELDTSKPERCET